MYRRIVAARVRKAWRHVQARDHMYVVNGFADEFTYRFVGDHALGGVRHTREAMDLWFRRVFVLVQGCRFEVDDVLVKGWPWRTRAVVLLRVVGELAGEPYENGVSQTIDLRWGRITAVTTLEDTQKLEGALDRLAAAGVEEAHAPPIEDAGVSGRAAT